MKKGFIKVLLLIGMLFLGIGNVHAEDGVFTFNIGGAEDKKAGDEFTVDVTVKGPSEEYTLDGYDIVISYDVNKLELIEGALDGKISSSEPINSDATLSTVKFKVKDGVTECSSNLTLSLNAVSQNGEDITKLKEKAKTNAGTVIIRNVSSDTSLKSLKIPNTVLSPEFNTNVYDYTATVTDVTSVDIDAKPTDPHSTIWITENSQNLVKGLNEITVVVKAENGTEKWYGIKLTLNVTPTEQELKDQDTTLQSLSIKGQKIDFTPTEKKYYINVDYDTTKITVNAIPTNAEAEVVITGNSKLVVGKNTVKINVTSKDKTKTDTYQLIVTRENEEKEIVKTCPDETSKKEWIIFTASLLLTFTLGIVLGYFLCRKEVLSKLFKKKTKEETPVEIETMSDTIDLSDTVKSVNEQK